jgi:short-subunit dehydrogenase
MGRRSLDGARAVVTGASSGIGRELARELARHGAQLIVTARREGRLRDLCEELTSAGYAARPVPGDITDHAVRLAVLRAADQAWGGLDVLVNNAGVGAIGPFHEAAPDRLRRILEVNFFAVAEMIRDAVPMLRQGRQPLVVNISSVLGHRAVPGKSEYCASKFALHGLSDALRAELSRLGIDVLLVSPSTTASEFFDNVLEDQGRPAWSSRGAMSPQAVARRTVRAMRRGSHEIILTPGGRLLVWLDRLCPPLANRLVARFG